MKSDNTNSRVDRGWDSMEILLEEKMPQKKDRRRILFILLLLGIICTAAYGYWTSMINTYEPLASISVNESDINLSAKQENKTPEKSIINTTINKDDLNTNRIEQASKNEAAQEVSLNSQSIQQEIKNSDHVIFDISNSTKSNYNKKRDILDEKNTVNNIDIEEGTDVINILNTNMTAFMDVASLDLPSLISIQKITWIDYNQINYNHSIPKLTLNISRYIKPIPKKENRQALNFYASSFFESFTNENINGWGLSLGLEYNINSRIYTGVDLSYHFANERQSEDLQAISGGGIPTGDDQEIDMPPINIENTPTEAITLQEANNYLNQKNTVYNHLSSMLKVGFHLTNKIDLEGYIAFDTYFNLKNLVDAGRVSNTNGFLNQDLYLIENKKFNTQSIGIALKYSVSNQFKLFGRYRNALSNITVIENQQFDPNAYQLGLEYHF